MSGNKQKYAISENMQKYAKKNVRYGGLYAKKIYRKICKNMREIMWEICEICGKRAKICWIICEIKQKMQENMQKKYKGKYEKNIEKNQ